MSYSDTHRPASFGAISIHPAVSALTAVFERVTHRGVVLSRFSPAEREDLGLNLRDLTPRPGVFARAVAALRAWNTRRLTVDALSRLSDAQLRDIGITRMDIMDLREGRPVQSIRLV